MYTVSICCAVIKENLDIDKPIALSISWTLTYFALQNKPSLQHERYSTATIDLPKFKYSINSSKNLFYKKFIYSKEGWLA